MIKKPHYLSRTLNSNKLLFFRKILLAKWAVPFQKAHGLSLRRLKFNLNEKLAEFNGIARNCGDQTLNSFVENWISNGCLPTRKGQKSLQKS